MGLSRNQIAPDPTTTCDALLLSLKLATPSIEIRFQRAVDAPGNDPRVHQQRSALALANGRVYVAFGGLAGDCGAYRGTVVAVSASSAGGELLFYRVPANREGGIWAPSGLAVDVNGHVYAVTGNTDSSGQFDMNDAVLRLSADLGLEDYWAPVDWLTLSRSDTDIGSVGPTLLPNDRVLESGKNGILYVSTNDDNVFALDATNGQVKWRWAPDNVGTFRNFGIVANRGVALCDGHVFILTLDMTIVQIDAATGKLERRVAIAKAVPGASASSGYSETSVRFP